MAASEDECFSDDSLEVPKKPTRKLKRKKKSSKERTTTYLALYQKRLACEFLKIRHVKASECSTPCPAPCPSEVTDNKNAAAQPESSKLQPNSIKKAHSQLWSEFLAKKCKKQGKSKSEADTKTEMFKKRLEYGKRMSLLNGFNIKCLNGVVRKGQKACKQPERPSDQPKPCKSKEAIEGCDDESNKPESDENRLSEITTKLSLLKLRHQSDKKIVEKIRESLRNSELQN